MGGGLLAVILVLTGCQNPVDFPPSSAPTLLSPGVTVSADRSEDLLRIASERERIAAEKAAALAQQLADEQAAEAQRLLEEQEAQRLADELNAQQTNPAPPAGAYTRDDVIGTVQSLTGLPIAVVFDATWCDSANYVCGGVYTRAPRAPSTVEELTVHMSDSPAWLYAQVGYSVAVHESGHILTAYYQPQILAAFGPAFLETNIEKIADCYLILHVGGTTGTSGYTFDGLEAEVAQWIVNNL
jgi:hypothetical protein